MSLAVSERLQDRYEVVRSIKSGGMGAVYEAVDHKLASTPCAIKEVLASALQGSSSAYVLASFESEMRALAGLEHPNIPRVRDYFEIQGKRYIILDLVQGQGLDDELADHLRLTNAAMDPAVAAVDMVQVLETLSYLHNCQPPIIHRDIKSANLIRDNRSGRIKLVDFGIARSVETQRVQTQVGTPGFCAPEQMAGRAELRSDLYSVGATLYHLCTGRLPPAFIFDALEMDLPRYPGLVKIVLKATQPKPSDRYASAEEMAQALRAWLRNEGSAKIDPAIVPAEPVVTSIHPLATVPVPSNSQYGMWAAVLAMLLAALGLLYSDYSSRFGNPSPTPIVLATPSLAPRPEKTTDLSLEREKARAMAERAVQERETARLAAQREELARERKLLAAELAGRQKVIPVHRERPRPDPGTGGYPQNTSHPSVSQATGQVARPTPPSPESKPGFGRSNSTLHGLPEEYEGLTRRWQGPGHYTAHYRGVMFGHRVLLKVTSSPGHPSAELQSMHADEMAGMTEEPSNEGPGEYCGWRVDGNTHKGLHFKDGLVYQLEIQPRPSARSGIWTPIKQFIRNYP